MGVFDDWIRRAFLLLILFGQLTPLQISNKGNTNKNDKASNSGDRKFHSLQTQQHKEIENTHHVILEAYNEQLSQTSFGETDATLNIIVPDTENKNRIQHLSHKSENKTNVKHTHHNSTNNSTTAGTMNGRQDDNPMIGTFVMDNVEKDFPTVDSRGTTGPLGKNEYSMEGKHEEKKESDGSDKVMMPGTESEEEFSGLDTMPDTKQHRQENDPRKTDLFYAEGGRRKGQIQPEWMLFAKDVGVKVPLDKPLERKGDVILRKSEAGRMHSVQNDPMKSTGGMHTILRTDNGLLKEDLGEDVDLIKRINGDDKMVNAKNGFMGLNGERNTKSDIGDNLETNANEMYENLNMKTDQISDSRVLTRIFHGENGGTEFTVGVDEMLEKDYGRASDTFELLKNLVESVLLIKGQTAADKPIDRGEERVEFKLGSNKTCGSTDGFDTGKNGKSRQKRSYYSGQTCRCRKCGVPVKGKNDDQVNIAWNKPTYSSSDYNGPHAEDYMGSCGAVNGIKNDPSKYQPNCFHSGLTDYRAVWMVDLQDYYTLSSMVLFRRRHVDDVPLQKYTVILVNGNVCLQYPSDDSGLKHFSVITAISCMNPVRGRYVSIEKEILATAEHPGTGLHFLIYCEIQIYVCVDDTHAVNMGFKCFPCPDPCKYGCDNYYGCGTRVLFNAAMKKPTTGSQLTYGKYQNAVDGRTDNPFDPKECLLLKETSIYMRNPFWQVDLQGDHLVFHIYVKNNFDCCGNTMTNFYLLVLRDDAEINANTLYDGRREVCNHWQGDFKNDGERKFLCRQPPVLGRYVMLQARPGTRLYLCEVKVMASTIKVLTSGMSGCASGNETRICELDLVCEDDVCKVPLGESCRDATKHQNCKSGATCDKAICKLALDTSCKGNPKLCKTGMECDLTSGSKCKVQFGGSCNSTTDCSKHSEGYVCDFVSECRKSVGMSCSNSYECLAGADCVHSKCKCENKFPASYLTGLCEPTCNMSAQLSCQDQHAVCDDEKKICECRDKFEFTRRGFKCMTAKAAVRASCNNTALCMKGLICQFQRCRIALHGFCDADSECVVGAVCDTYTCQHDAGTSCKTIATCRSDAICDRGFCKLSLGKDCRSHNLDCASTTTCSRKNNQLICLKSAGTSCYGDNATMCMAGTVCEKYVCSTELGGPCNESDAHCQYSSVCEDGLCRLILGADCTNKERYCAQGLRCDHLHECRIPRGENCSSRPDGCVAGGYCTHHNVCECSTVNTKINTPLCDPKPGVVAGTCDSKNKKICHENFTRCNESTALCECVPGFGVQGNNYTCKFAPGSACVESYECGSDMECYSTHTCLFVPGVFCRGKNSMHCGSGTFCDDDEKCRFTQGVNCTSHPHSCRLGYVCDRTFRCKVPAGSKCYNNETCEAGTSCIDNWCACTKPRHIKQSLQCDTVPGAVGGSCNSVTVECSDENAVCNKDNMCECRSRYLITQDLDCGKGIGLNCEEDAECASGLYCDDFMTCKVPLGGRCDRNYDMCGFGATCDIDDTCKLMMSGNCGGSKADQCLHGTQCGWMNKCRFQVGKICNKSDECVTGAICKDKICACDTETSIQRFTVCVPKTGRVGSECDETKTCEVEGSVCDAGVCLCADELEVSQDFACGSALQESVFVESSGNFGWIGIVLVSSAVVVAVLGVLGLAAYHRKQADKAKQEQIQSETESFRPLPGREMNVASVTSGTVTSDMAESQTGDATSSMDLESETGNTTSSMDQESGTGNTTSSMDQESETGNTTSSMDADENTEESTPPEDDDEEPQT